MRSWTRPGLSLYGLELQHLGAPPAPTPSHLLLTPTFPWSDKSGQRTSVCQLLMDFFFVHPLKPPSSALSILNCISGFEGASNSLKLSPSARPLLVALLVAC